MTKITYVEPGSIAEDAGIEAGDFLVALNGKKVNDILHEGSKKAQIQAQAVLDGAVDVIKMYK